jgi:2-amino-4-hydroxy-6-hydroxymethyldihydropteridine diphosphokinase
MAVWQPAYIGLGSNLSDPALQVRQALHSLTGLPQTLCVAVSRLYGSRPMGPVTQPDFVNAVAGLVTQLSALELLRQLRILEEQAGRPAVHEHWGPRVIDLDLLVFGREQCASA